MISLKGFDKKAIKNLPSKPPQRAEAILNKISYNVNKTHTGLISVIQGFQKYIA